MKDTKKQNVLNALKEVENILKENKKPKFKYRLKESANVLEPLDIDGKEENLPPEVAEFKEPDTIIMSVPLFIRMLEFAREDATDDEILHTITEKLIALGSSGAVLTMDSYDSIIDKPEGSIEINTSEEDDFLQETVKKVLKDKMKKK